jgi:hypothetical protein
MSGDAIENTITGAFMALGGFGFARLGWAGLRRPAAEPGPGRELAAPSSAGSVAMKARWGFCLVFGIFVLGCGILLSLAGLFPGSGS